MTLRHATGLALVLLLMGVSAAAQEPTYRVVADTAAADSLWQLDLDPVVVTATRAARQADEVAVPVSVIGRQQIESQGAALVTDLLAN